MPVGLNSPQRAWPAGVQPRMQQGLRPQQGIGMPGLSAGMSQPMQAGINPAMAQVRCSKCTIKRLDCILLACTIYTAFRGVRGAVHIQLPALGLRATA